MIGELFAQIKLHKTTEKSLMLIKLITLPEKYSMSLEDRHQGKTLSSFLNARKSFQLPNQKEDHEAL